MNYPETNNPQSIMNSDLKLTAGGFFRLFSEFLGSSETNEDAYYKVIELCDENNISYPYNTYNSFRTTCYRVNDKKLSDLV